MTCRQYRPAGDVLIQLEAFSRKGKLTVALTGSHDSPQNMPHRSTLPNSLSRLGCAENRAGSARQEVGLVCWSGLNTWTLLLQRRNGLCAVSDRQVSPSEQLLRRWIAQTNIRARVAPSSLAMAFNGSLVGNGPVCIVRSRRTLCSQNSFYRNSATSPFSPFLFSPSHSSPRSVPITSHRSTSASRLLLLVLPFSLSSFSPPSPPHLPSSP